MSKSRAQRNTSVKRKILFVTDYLPVNSRLYKIRTRSKWSNQRVGKAFLIGWKRPTNNPCGWKQQCRPTWVVQAYITNNKSVNYFNSIVILFRIVIVSQLVHSRFVDNPVVEVSDCLSIDFCFTTFPGLVGSRLWSLGCQIQAVSSILLSGNPRGSE